MYIDWCEQLFVCGNGFVGWKTIDHQQCRTINGESGECGLNRPRCGRNTPFSV